MRKGFILASIILILISAFVIGSLGARNDRVPASADDTNQNTSVSPTIMVVPDNATVSGFNSVVMDNLIDLSPDMERIISRGKIIVGIYSEDRPPFFFAKDNGELSGFDINLAQNIASYLGVGIEFNRQATTFNELTDLLIEGEVDMVVSKFSKTLDRAKIIRFSKTYINLKRALLVNKVQAVKLGIENYPMDYLREANFQIGVVEGTSFVEYSKEMFENATIIQYKQWDQAVEALVNGEILVALYDDNEVIRLVRQKPDIALYASVFVLKDQKDSIAIAVPWQSSQLLAWINDYLDAFEIQEDVNALIKEYPELYQDNDENKSE
ncbi:MAG: substrate-binding periplasmic protein [Mobilitalea sp.]